MKFSAFEGGVCVASFIGGGLYNFPIDYPCINCAVRV
jgi:hypothetical protein